MKRLLASLCLLVLVNVTGRAIDLEGLEAIGPVTGFTKTTNGVLLACADH